MELSKSLNDKQKASDSETIPSVFFETLINAIDIGVICTDNSGAIKKINVKAKEIFKIDDNFLKKNIKELIDIEIEEIMKQKGNIKREFFKYRYKGHEAKGFYNLMPIVEKNEIQGALFTFEKLKETVNFYNKNMRSDMCTTLDDIVGSSEAIKKVKDYTYKVAKGNSTVLINGESGTGKELFARAIHSLSDRNTGPFIPVNCAAIPDNLLESELFGYEEGSFTGARKGGKPGKFELANNGTIFLDEIGDLHLHLQAKLLRVLQENVVERVGAKNYLPINVRVIAATNKELHEKVEEGEFREDLFYRLSVIPIRIPALRDRKSDILIISERFLRKFNKIMNKNIIDFDEKVKEKFITYIWPGNVRELENVIEFSVNMACGDVISIYDLPTRFRDKSHRKKELYNELYEELCEIEDDTITPIDDLIRKEIEKALNLYGRNKKGVIKAAEVLGISRATLYRKIKSYEEEVSN